MNQYKENMYRIDTDKAWKTLYGRLEKDNLLTVAKKKDSSDKKRRIIFQRIAAVAAISIGFVFSTFYFMQKKDNSQIILRNTDNSGTLVSTFADGSTVYLASNASVSYPVAFTKNRRVELNGNALFYVTKDEKHPFVVMTNGITIEVVGTVFAVQSTYHNPFELFVKEGKVNVHSHDDRIGVSVEAGESVQLNKVGLSKSKKSNSLIFSHFTEKMSFKDEKLNHIIQAINSIHGAPVLITEESINNRSLTVTFDNNSVETMTELICAALNLEKINKQDTILIRPFFK